MRNADLSKLVKIYFSNQHFDKLTFYGLYQEWLAYKKTVVNSQNTIKRHEQHYRKYFETSLLHERRIKYLDELTLESECNRIIRQNEPQGMGQRERYPERDVRFCCQKTLFGYFPHEQCYDFREVPTGSKKDWKNRDLQHGRVGTVK